MISQLLALAISLFVITGNVVLAGPDEQEQGNKIAVRLQGQPEGRRGDRSESHHRNDSHDDHDSHDSHDHHHHRHHDHEHDHPIHLKPDVGFYAFNFGRVGTLAFQSFYRNSEELELLEVNDCFCGGDSFVVYDHGQILNFVDSYCDPGQGNCTQYSENPFWCYSYYGWCYGYMWLAPGHHNLTIGVLKSPYGGGTGYLKLSSVCEKEGSFWSCCSYTNSCINNVYYPGLLKGDKEHSA